MTRNTRLAAIMTLASLMALTDVAQAAEIYQCTQADGSITLSDVACPPDTLTREYRGEATAGGQDPWSERKLPIDDQAPLDRQRFQVWRVAPFDEPQARDLLPPKKNYGCTDSWPAASPSWCRGRRSGVSPNSGDSLPNSASVASAEISKLSPELGTGRNWSPELPQR